MKVFKMYGSEVVVEHIYMVGTHVFLLSDSKYYIFIHISLNYINSNYLFKFKNFLFLNVKI